MLLAGRVGDALGICDVVDGGSLDLGGSLAGCSSNDSPFMRILSELSLELTRETGLPDLIDTQFDLCREAFLNLGI